MASETRAALRDMLTSLRNECRGLLGAFHAELVAATSITNVRVLERKVAEADALLTTEAEPEQEPDYKALLTALVVKVSEVINSDAYKGMATIAWVHGFRYDGPDFKNELDAALAALPAPPTEREP